MMLSTWVVLLLVAKLAIVLEGCKQGDKEYHDGEEWIQKDTFVMQCKMPGDGSWRVEVVACMSPSGKRIDINSTAVDGADEWHCLVTPDGKITMQQGVNAFAKCGTHEHGDTWREKSFLYECKRGGQQKLVACVAENGEQIAVGEGKLINGYLVRCQQFDNGTVVIHGTRHAASEDGTKFEMHCVDSKGENHAVGSWWLDNHRFNKTCTESGRIEVVNCVSRDGHKIPVDMKMVIGETKYVCEKTKDGAIRFASGPAHASE